MTIVLTKPFVFEFLIEFLICNCWAITISIFVAKKKKKPKTLFIYTCAFCLTEDVRIVT